MTHVPVTAPTIVLFDIDGTLVSTGGAGRRAMEWAFTQLHGRPDACTGFSMGGMTDRAIVRKALAAIDVDASDADIDLLLDTYLGRLAVEMAAATDARVLPGVPAAIAATFARPQTAVGLGTGNVRRGAEIKLEALGLMTHFAFGGFGCDHEDRTELLAAGARRGAEALSQPLTACHVLVIGDTPKDVSAAHGLRAYCLDAHCLAVATGPFAEDELHATGATWVVPTLDHDVAQRVLAGLA